MKANGNFAYDPSINHKIQGFIYKNLEGSFFEDLHNKKGAKYFCFSNIFPPKYIKQDEEVNLIISSPIRELIKIIYAKLRDKEIVNIGDYSFVLLDKKSFDIQLKEDRVRMYNSTPIVIRLLRDKFKFEGKYKYLYWRKGMDMKIFVDQLVNNIIKKYERFFGVKVEVDRVFELLKLRKETTVTLQVNGKNSTIIGTYWEFETFALDEESKKLLKFAIDTGFGEMNSLGFGFINPVKDEI
ncbi:MAG: CRISPR-associated endoribonuclease Cas6 [Caldisphaera sp.]